MTLPGFTSVDLKCVHAVDPAKQPGKARFLFRDSHQMNVVRHETVSPEFYACLCFILGQEVEIIRIVRLVEKGGLPAISSLGDVVRESRNYQSWKSRHAICINKYRLHAVQFSLTGFQMFISARN
jgi:hypothetical protein